MAVIQATQEGEAGELLEPGRWRLWWAKIVPLHSSLGNKSETLTQMKKKKEKKKSNPKTHNCQIYQDWHERKNIKGSQRERLGYPQREAHQTADLTAETLQARREGEPIFNILKKTLFNPEFCMKSN